ncbi:MAG: hypothetical protein WCY93_07410 [Anaerolineaceae bacterium]
MHIHFQKIRYQNLLSVGDHPVEVNLEKSRTVLISGKNGHGKSTLCEALVFGLYGKPFRKINKPQLVNSINKKGLLVEIWFRIGGDEYLVKRGIKPNILEIEKNGSPLDKDAATRDQQEYLEDKILRMSAKSFTQIVILGSAVYTPFMDLAAAQRREIIEDLLDIQVFSVMAGLLKEKIGDNKAALTSTNHELDLVKVRLDSAVENRDNIQKMLSEETDKIKSQMNEHVSTIETEMRQIKVLEEEMSDLENTITDKDQVTSEIQSIKKVIRDLEFKQKTLRDEIQFYDDHENCPTCKQSITEKFKENLVSTRKSNLSEIEAGINKLTTRLDVAENRLQVISGVADKITSVYNQVSEHKINIRISKSALQDLKQKLETSSEAELQDQHESKIKELEDSKRKLLRAQSGHLEDKDVLSVVTAMLKDTGIKTSIIRQYVPIMNQMINKYLSRFELFVDFNLDETFNETIKSRHRDAFSFSSFSEGEKMRINLSIMFAWRAIAKMRNSVSTNILFLDEILDGPSDSEGVENLIDIINTMGDNDNIFVISHRSDTFAEKFEQHLQFEKVRNFTFVAGT